MNLYNLLTKKNDDLVLYENGVLRDDGRLTTEGRDLVVDLMFQGKNVTEIRKLLVDEIKKNKKDK